MSDSANTAAASGTIRAPWEVYSPSMIAEPSPAPAWITTSWPCSASSRTPAGVSATRYSSVLISVGTPTFKARSFPSGDELAPAQREPEVDAVARRVEGAPGELLDAPDPVAQRVAVAVELARRLLPLAVALDERLQRTHQLPAVGALALLDRGKDGVAEQAQSIVVLQREQQLERAEVAVGGQQRRPRPVGAVLVSRERPGLQRAARLVEGAAQLARRRRAAGAGRQLEADVARDPRADALGELEGVVLRPPPVRDQRTRERPGAGGEATGRLVPHRGGQRLLDLGLDRPRGLHHEHADAIPEPERL